MNDWWEIIGRWWRRRWGRWVVITSAVWLLLVVSVGPSHPSTAVTGQTCERGRVPECQVTP